MQNWLNESLLSLDSCDSPEVFDFLCDYENAESSSTSHPAGESFKLAREACPVSPPPFSLTCTDSDIFPSTSFSRAHTPAPYPPSPYTHRYNPTPNGVVPSCSPAPPATPASLFYAAESPFADANDLMCDLTNDGLASGAEDEMLPEKMLDEAEDDEEDNTSYYATDAVRGLSKVQTKGKNSMSTTSSTSYSSTSSSSSSSTSACRAALAGPDTFLMDDHAVLLHTPSCPLPCPAFGASAMSVSEPTALGDGGTCKDFAEEIDVTAAGVGMQVKNGCSGHTPESTNPAFNDYQTVDLAELDPKMARAFQTSYQTGSLTPLIKEELKYTIMNRRHSAGQEEIVVQFPTPARYELNDEETKRRQLRLEKNRAAAARHREKKKVNKRQDEEELGALEARNTELRQKVQLLETEIRTVRSLLSPAPE